MPGTIGIDVGGTGVRAALVDASGEVGEVSRRALTDRSIGHVVQTITELTRDLGASAIGVGVPGFVRAGVVLGSPNFPTWRDVPLARLLGEATGLPVAVHNDANCAAWGAWVHLGRSGDLVALTLGTGVGGGIVTAGRLLTGSGGTGAEVGHIYAGGEARCGCGAVGCLETWTGTAGLMARGQGRDGRQLLVDARAGDAGAREVLSRAGAGLGRGLASLVNLFNPDTIALMGGLCEARDFLEPAMKQTLADQAIAQNAEALTVVWLDRADAFAIAGAATLIGAV